MAVMGEQKSLLKAEFETSVSAKDLMDFKLYHNYHSFSGIASVIVGLIMLSLCIVTLNMENVNITYTLMTAFFGLFFTVWTPIGMYLSVRKQMKKIAAFKEPVRYTVTLEKIVLSQGEITEELLWDDIYKIVSTGKSFILYITTIKANIIPIRDMGDEAEVFVKIARKKLKPFQVKIKSIKR